MNSTKRGYPKICTVLYWDSVWQEGYSYRRQIARQHSVCIVLITMQNLVVVSHTICARM